MTTLPLTHAGGIVYRRRENDIEVLIVRARPAPHDWVLPKGHIDPGETPETCARREIREEAGVDAEPEVMLGVDRYLTARGPVIVAFYLLRYVRDVLPDEIRETRWVRFAEARDLILFDGMRTLILDAQTRLVSDKT